MSRNNDENCTPDMYLAAVMISYGAKIINVDRSNKKRLKFCFDPAIDYIWILESGQQFRKVPNPSFNMIKNEFTSKTLLLLPNYSDAIRSIKSMIHEDE